jgi:probable F420-dependent oxidoreductase
MDVRAAADVGAEAESLGYTDLWAAEVSGTDGLAVCSAIGVKTSSARIGVAITPVYSRPPALLAMGAAAAQQASGGRFTLGLGASTPTIVEGWMGQSFERPIGRMRETIEVLRRAWSGEKVDHDGTFTARGFRMEAPLEKPVPIFLAALGPQMLQLARDEADGVVLFATSEQGVRLAREAVPDKELVARLIVVPGGDAAQVHPFAQWMLAPYIAAPGYNPWIARQGFEREAEAISNAWSSGDRATAREAVTERLIEALVLYGEPARIKDRLASFYDAGLSTPILMLISQEGPEALRSAIESLAP